MKPEPKFDHWCIVELFGHQKVAGHCTEENIAGTNFLRIDIPETDKQPALTKYYGASAVYAITPVDEKTARKAAENMEVAPVMAWQGESFLKKFTENKLALPEGNSDLDDFDDDDGYQTTDRSEGGY